MKLRTIVIILALIAILSAAISSGLIYAALKKKSDADARTNAASRTDVIGARVNLILSEGVKTVRAVAGLPAVIHALTTPDDDAVRNANQVLEGLQQALEIDVCYLMDADGLTRASSNHDSPKSFVGKNYAFRPYFQQAIRGQTAVYMAVGVTSGKRGIYYGHPVYDHTRSVPVGVAVIKAAPDAIAQTLRQAHHQGLLLLTDPHGLIFLADRSEHQGRLLWRLSEADLAEIAASRQFSAGPWPWTGFRPTGDGMVADDRGRRYLMHTAAINVSPGWRIVHLSNWSAVGKMLSDPILDTFVPIGISVCGLISAAVFLLFKQAQRDLASRSRMQARLTRQTEYAAALHAVSLGILDRLDLDELLQSILQGACSLLKTSHAYIYLLNADGRDMRLRKAIGGRFEQMQDLLIQPGQGISGEVWESGQARCIQDYSQWPERIPHEALDAFHSIIAVPVLVDHSVLGVLGVGFVTKPDDPPPEEATDILTRFSELIAVSLDNARLFHQKNRILAEQQEVEAELQASLAHSQRQKAEIQALLKAFHTVVNSGSFEEGAQVVFKQCKATIGAAAGYIAVFNQTTRENDILFDDGYSAGADRLDPALQTSLEELATEASRRQTVVYRNTLTADTETTPPSAGRFHLNNVLLVPMIATGKYIGMMGLANKPGGFTKADVRLATAFGDQTATALQQSQTLEALEKSETRFRSVIEKNADAIMVVDQEGVVQFANAAAEQFFNRSEGSLVGSPFGFPITTGEGTEIEVPQADGTSAIAEMRLVETEWEGATVYFASLRDVSERVAAERERELLEKKLRQSQKMEAIGTLAGGIAHDFNNILSAVIGFTEVSLDLVEKDSQLHLNLKEVAGAGYRAKELVRQILTFSRQSEQEPSPIQVSHLVKEVIKLLRASLPTTIAIEQYLHSDSQVMADATQIHQVLMNLCANAGFVMRDTGGTLTISVRDVAADEDLPFDEPVRGNRRYQRISVGDTGPGIDPHQLDRIFDPFFTTKDKGEGTGMGLSVVHGIVNGHGGHIRVDNNPGQGATFHVFLPIIADKKQDVAREKVSQLPHGSEHILLVDDESAITKMEKQVLERLGYQVVDMSDSREALTLVQSDPGRFDLLITDLTMPAMTGLELARKVHDIRPDLPVILSTGFSGDLKEEDLKANNIRGLLRKPPLQKEMATTVRNVLDGHSAFNATA